MTPGDAVTRRPGRPRDARAGAAILQAAAQVLADGGPQGFTVDAVAAAAGVGKATIYRRWPTRAALLLEAAGLLGLEIPDRDEGSLVDELTHHLTLLSDKMHTTPSGKLLAAIIAEAVVNPDMRSRLRAFVSTRRTVAAASVARGIARGDLPADTDVDQVLDLLGGSIFYRFLTGGEPTGPDEVRWLVETVVAGLRVRAGYPDELPS